MGLALSQMHTRPCLGPWPGMQAPVQPKRPPICLPLAWILDSSFCPMGVWVLKMESENTSPDVILALPLLS